MWLFEKRGFVSVVAYDPKKDANAKSGFRKIAKQAGTHLLVRARIEADLDWLKETVPSLAVETDKGADYAFRAVITRKQFKTALAKSVDGIDYDSHFKEAAAKDSPKAQGRYSAMMSVWTAMSKLQPYTPWGEASSSSSSWSWGSGSSKSSSSSSSSSSTKAVTPAKVRSGAKDVEAFIDAYVKSGGEATFRTGGGPLTGFKAKDRVVGYAGPGVVVKVEDSKFSTGESVRVKLDSGKTSTFVSNFLMPETLPDLPKAEADTDLDQMYSHLLTFTQPGADEALILDEETEGLDDDAMELLTRVQNLIHEGEIFNTDVLDETYDEILWESSTDQDRLSIWSDAASVPAAYEQDAIKLFSSSNQ